LSEELHSHLQSLEQRRGSKFVGLTQQEIPRLDQATLGLRGLMLLAAGPNMGKTSLGVQLGIDVLCHNPDACFMFLSLEMPREAIVTRILCLLARLDWRNLLSGETQASPTETVDQALVRAQKELSELGERILILDEDNFPQINLQNLAFQLERLKQASGARRAFVLVDYLQVLPIPQDMCESFGVSSDQEADRWRIGLMKRLRDVSGEAVMVISEARKPDSGRQWAVALKDVLGSERNAYTPDMVFLLQPLDRDEMLKVWGGDPKKAQNEIDALGLIFTRLTIAKGRDGVVHDSLDLTFWHRQSRFASGFRRL
jgi:hypothetical protein